VRLPRSLIVAVALGAAASACSAGPLTEQTETVIVHAGRALPPAMPSTLDSMSGVRWTRVATTAMVNLVRIDGGKALDRRSAGTVLPFSIAAAEPLPGARDDISRWLAEGKAVLPTTSARLRGLGPGGVITIGLGGKREAIEIGGVRDDPRTVEVEALVPLAAARRLGVTEIRQIIAAVTASERIPYESQARTLASPVPVRVGSHEDIATPAAGKLLSLAEIKERFGEFSFVPGSGRWLEPDPVWQAANIVDVSVPVLGSMRCHRKVIAPLTAAMRDVEAAGLQSLIVENAFCYAPRVQFGDNRVISRHTWGIAVDINPTDNAFGALPTQDERLIAIMARHGFAWGGVWLTPDGMHFEYTGL